MLVSALLNKEFKGRPANYYTKSKMISPLKVSANYS